MTDAVPCISGMIIGRERDAARRLFGSAAERALQQLEPVHRREILEALPVGWVSCDAQNAWLAALARELGRDEAEVHHQLVVHVQQLNFRTVWKLALRFASDSAILSRAGSLYTRMLSVGRLHGVELGPGEARLELRGWSTPPAEATLRGIRGTVEVVLARAGRRDVSVRQQRVPGGADFHVKWTV